MRISGRKSQKKSLDFESLTAANCDIRRARGGPYLPKMKLARLTQGPVVSTMIIRGTFYRQSSRLGLKGSES
jgi:hypothetical protein